MDAGEVLGAALSLIVGIGLCVLYGFFVYWTVKFFTSVPKYLKRIAEALEKIANK